MAVESIGWHCPSCHPRPSLTDSKTEQLVPIHQQQLPEMRQRRSLCHHPSSIVCLAAKKQSLVLHLEAPREAVVCCSRVPLTKLALDCELLMAVNKHRPHRKSGKGSFLSADWVPATLLYHLAIFNLSLFCTIWKCVKKSSTQNLTSIGPVVSCEVESDLLGSNSDKGEFQLSSFRFLLLSSPPDAA